MQSIMLHASVETNVPWEVTLILYSKLDLPWSTPANILKDRKLRVRGDWKGMRLTNKVCGYLIFVTSLYAYEIPVYFCLFSAAISFIFLFVVEVLCSFIYCSQLFLLLLLLVFVISSFVVGYFSYQTKYTCNLL